MKIWLSTLAVLASTLAQPPLEGVDHSYATLLLGTEAESTYAARVLAHDPAAPSQVLDVAAALLWQGCLGRRALRPSLQAHLAQALGESGQTRYWDVLADCKEKGRDAKVRKQAAASLDVLPGGNVAQFEPRAFDLALIGTQLAASVARDAARRPAPPAGVAQGQSLASVYGRLGLPDSVHVNTVGFTGLLAVYDKLGAIGFTRAGGDRGGWLVASITPAGANAHAVQVRQWLATGDPQVLKRVAKDLVRGRETDRAVLDAVADRIDRDFDTDDKELAGALAALCQVLAASGDGRYWEFLHGIGAGSTTRQLSGHAQKAAHKLPSDDPDPYRPPSLKNK